MTAAERFESELELLLRAKYPLIFIVTAEEDRVEASILRVSRRLASPVTTWSVTGGMSNVGAESSATRLSSGEIYSALDSALQGKDKSIYVFKDVHPFLDDPRVVRKFRDLCRAVTRSSRSAIALGPVLRIPAELEKDMTVLDFPLPDSEELGALLDNIVKTVGKNQDVKVSLEDPQARERLVKASLGLTRTEAENAFAKAIVSDRRLDESDVGVILAEKKQIIRKSGLLEYYDVSENLNDVGGLSLLKEWVRKRSKAFSARARDFGLPEPKGLLLLGVQGCGKSLAAKAIASAWQLPLLRLDLGAVFGKYVGESESRIRQAIKTAESIAPVVLWLDEMEKGLSGVKGTEDSGTSARVFGTFLTWMQEKVKPVFVVATANDVTALPPELLRKGRFDEIFFVDLPDERERTDIFRIHLLRRGRDPAKFGVEQFAKLSVGYSGAEIEQALISALYDAFDSGRDLVNEDIERNIVSSIPLSRTMKEKVDSLRAWANGRAMSASRAGE